MNIVGRCFFAVSRSNPRSPICQECEKLTGIGSFLTRPPYTSLPAISTSDQCPPVRRPRRTSLGGTVRHSRDAGRVEPARSSVTNSTLNVDSVAKRGSTAEATMFASTGCLPISAPPPLVTMTISNRHRRSQRGAGSIMASHPSIGLSPHIIRSSSTELKLTCVMLAGVTVPTLAFSEIDKIMSTIDLLRPESLHNRDGDGPVFRSFQCFGVFDANITNSPHTPPSLLGTEACSPAITSSSGSPPISLPTYSAESAGAAISLDAPNCPDMTSNMSSDVDSLLGIEYFDSCPFHPEDSVLPIPPGSPLDLVGGGLSYNDLRIAFNSFQDTSPLHERDQQFQSNEASNEGSNIMTRQDQSLPNIPSAPSFNVLSNEETFLMHHYATKVVHLFVTLDNPKSPWQTIHLPRALQSAGELLVCNSTSGIRHSLRSSLLAISAFCLSNDYKIGSHQDLAQTWNRRGTYYRGKALMHLKQVVESGISAEPRPKYKEVLATMLSMVSINVWFDLTSCPGSHNRFSNMYQVMSGDTDTSGVHLDGARKFIDQAKCWKVRYSNKALALHRIYFYLHTIY